MESHTRLTTLPVLGHKRLQGRETKHCNCSGDTPETREPLVDRQPTLPYRILLLHGIPPQYMGGAEFLTLDVLRCLPPNKYRVTAAVKPGGRFEKGLHNIGVATVDLPLEGVCPTRTNRLIMLSFLFRNLRAAIPVSRMIKQGDVDLIYTASRGALLCGSVAGYLAHVPVVVHLHDIPRRSWLYAAFARLGATRIIAPSIATRRLFMRDRLFGQGLIGRTRVVYYGLDLARLVPSRDADAVREELGLDGAYPVIGIVGRIEETKGQREVVDAAREIVTRFPEACLVFVGDVRGPGSAGYFRDLQRTIRQHSLEDHVIFTGFRTDVPNLLNAFDMVVSASWSETFGLSLAEAMALGKPVVATDVGGTGEVVSDGETGLLVPSQDSPSLASAVVNLASDRSTMTAMGVAGRSRVESRFSMESYVQGVTSVYEEILGSD